MAKLRLSLREKQVEHLHSLLDDGESVAQFVRRAVEREIERRELETRRDVAQSFHDWAAREAARKEPLK